eukprot:319481-Pleurochrysis_carterae.AAC.2
MESGARTTSPQEVHAQLPRSDLGSAEFTYALNDLHSTAHYEYCEVPCIEAHGSLRRLAVGTVHAPCSPHSAGSRRGQPPRTPYSTDNPNPCAPNTFSFSLPFSPSKRPSVAMLKKSVFKA